MAKMNHFLRKAVEIGAGETAPAVRVRRAAVDDADELVAGRVASPAALFAVEEIGQCRAADACQQDAGDGAPEGQAFASARLVEGHLRGNAACDLPREPGSHAAEGVLCSHVWNSLRNLLGTFTIVAWKVTLQAES